MEMDEVHIPVSPPSSSSSSLKTKLKNSLCFSCCFRRLHHHHHDGHGQVQVLDSPPSSVAPSSDEKPALLWLKNRAPLEMKEEIKDMCMTVLGRIGNGCAKHKRPASAGEFRYDPLSYSLNFEDGFDDDDEYPLRNFSARLPPSQPPPAAQAAPPLRQITAMS